MNSGNRVWREHQSVVTDCIYHPRTEFVTADLVDGRGVQAGITAEVFEEAPEAVNESLGSM